MPANNTDKKLAHSKTALPAAGPNIGKVLYLVM